MKTLYLKILIVLIATLSASSINAQYQSLFGSTNTSWNIFNSEFAGNFTDSLSVCCDTTINGKIYKKIDYYGLPSTSVIPTIKGFLREDTVLGRAWYFTTADTNERLIMDLNLTLTDSFQLFNFNSNLNAYYQVDSVYVKNGKKHIRLDVIPSHLQLSIDEKFTMIEGVGPNIGIQFSDNNFPIHNPYLLCSYKNSNIEYQNTSTLYGGLCKVISTDIKERENSTNIKLYPNPSSNHLIIENLGQQNSNVTIEIRSITGKLVLTQKAASFKKVVVNTSQIPAGIYFVTVKGETKTITTQKWVKME